MRGGAGAGHGKQQTRFCLSVTMEMKKSIMGYSPGGPKPFLRVALATPNLVAPARGIMESGLSLGTDGMGSRAFLTYESNVLYALRFMVDKGVVGGCWVTLPKGKYCLGPNGKVGAGVLNASGSSASASASASHHHHATATHCQIEAHVHAKDLIAHAPEGEWARLAPLRVLSFDIECAGRKVGIFFLSFSFFFILLLPPTKKKLTLVVAFFSPPQNHKKKQGHFPEPSQDPVIQIASMVTVREGRQREKVQKKRAREKRKKEKNSHLFFSFSFSSLPSLSHLRKKPYLFHRSKASPPRRSRTSSRLTAAPRSPEPK